jgi:hypothetical protein
MDEKSLDGMAAMMNGMDDDQLEMVCVWECDGDVMMVMVMMNGMDDDQLEMVCVCDGDDGVVMMNGMDDDQLDA